MSEIAGAHPNSASRFYANAPQSEEFSSRLRGRRGRALCHARYFSFTKSKTKIAHTPTVTGNCTKAASRNEPPRGSAYVSNIIARAVSTPSANLLFQLMSNLTFPELVGSQAGGSIRLRSRWNKLRLVVVVS